jgi:hypothetical protein
VICALCNLPTSGRVAVRCVCELTERERKLPHWAQLELHTARCKALMELDRRRTLEAALTVRDKRST